MKSYCVLWLLARDSSVHCWGSRALGPFILLKIVSGILPHTWPVPLPSQRLRSEAGTEGAVGDTGSVPMWVTDFSEVTVVCYFC